MGFTQSQPVARPNAVNHQMYVALVGRNWGPKTTGLILDLLATRYTLHWVGRKNADIVAYCGPDEVPVEVKFPEGGSLHDRGWLHVSSTHLTMTEEVFDRLLAVIEGVSEEVSPF